MMNSIITWYESIKPPAEEFERAKNSFVISLLVDANFPQFNGPLRQSMLDAVQPGFGDLPEV